MIPPSPTGTFGLSALRYAEFVPVNDTLAPAVAAAFSRESAAPHRRIEAMDAEMLSQYARLSPITHVVARTANLDMVNWACAGLDTTATVVLDDRLPALLTSTSTDFRGNWIVAESRKHPGVSAILSDRADVIEFSDAIKDDLLSGQHAFLILYNAKDIPANEFIARARAAEIRVEIISAHRSLAVFDCNEGSLSRRQALVDLFSRYVEALKTAPEYLRPRVRNEGGWTLLTDSFATLLAHAYEAAAAVAEPLGVADPAKPQRKTDENFRKQSLALAESLRQLLDVKNNAVAAMLSRDYRDRVIDLCRDLALHDSQQEPFREALLSCYEIAWEVTHIIASLTYHSLAANETIRLAVDPSTKGVLVPKPYKPFDEYMYFYRYQDFRWRVYASDVPAAPVIRWHIANHIDHYTRFWQAAALIELLFMIIRRERPDETIRWLDLGCSDGLLANQVRLEDCLPDRNWEIVGVDWNASAIAIASKRARAQRRFMIGDATDAVKQLGGGGFNIVSAFEFVEHLEDPVKTIRDCSSVCQDYFIAGSPREERQDWLPVANHIWTFDRQGFEEIFRAAGLQVTFANETLVGKFCNGADWLTVIAGRGKTFPQIVNAIA